MDWNRNVSIIPSVLLILIIVSTTVRSKGSEDEVIKKDDKATCLR